MDILDPGHMYELRELDQGESFTNGLLVFVKREGDGYPGNVGHYPGTTTQEVLRALIDRTKYVDGQIEDIRNKEILYHLRWSIFLLEHRAAERHGRAKGFVEIMQGNLHEIENMPTCEKCGHIGCFGTCHPFEDEITSGQEA